MRWSETSCSNDDDCDIADDCDITDDCDVADDRADIVANVKDVIS